MHDYHYDNDLILEGILRFKAKEYGSARIFFERALGSADDNHTRAWANFYLSRLTDDPVEKRKYLEETLAIDMAHAEARRDLAMLDGKLKPEEIVNPEAISPPAAGVEAAQANRFTCPRCGGRMVYSPDGASLVCEYCSRQQALETGSPGKEADFFVAMANGRGFRKTVSVKTFRCQGCGANFMLASSEISATCSYCGSFHVIALEKERELLEPDAIIPLAFDQKQASLELVQWVERHKILPQGKIQAPRGLYLPVWAFNFIGSIPWNGRVMRDNVEVPVSGEAPTDYNDVCVPGSHKLEDFLPKLLPEYGISTARAYNPRFLAGWPAEIYETAMSDAALDARQSVVMQVRDLIRSNEKRLLGLSYSSANLSITSYRLILLPVWVTDYTLDNKTFRVVINGETGTVHGETPGHGLKDMLEDLLGA